MRPTVLPVDLMRIIGQYTEIEITWMGIWMSDAPPPPNWNTDTYQRKMYQQITNNKTSGSYQYSIMLHNYYIEAFWVYPWHERILSIQTLDDILVEIVKHRDLPMFKYAINRYHYDIGTSPNGFDPYQLWRTRDTLDKLNPTTVSPIDPSLVSMARYVYREKWCPDNVYIYHYSSNIIRHYRPRLTVTLNRDTWQLFSEMLMTPIQRGVT